MTERCNGILKRCSKKKWNGW